MTRKPGGHLEFYYIERGLFSKSEAKAALSGETYLYHLAFLMENERALYVQIGMTSPSVPIRCYFVS